MSMKKKAISLMLVLLLIVCSIPLMAQEVSAADIASGSCGDSLTWVLAEDGTLTISGTGDMKNYTSSTGSSGSGTWLWTSYISKVTKVVIKDGVTSIGNYAFYKCVNMTSITIPSSVTSIGNMAFGYCSSLPAITIPDSVTTIKANSTFYGCTALASVKLPAGLTNITASMFGSCSSLTEITIPDTVTSIGASAFSGCSGLTTLKIPSSVTSIGNTAFSKCTSLSKVRFMGNAPTFGSNIFSNTTQYLAACYPAGNSTWTSSNKLSYGGGNVVWVSVGLLGSGTSSSPYQIRYASDLEYLKEYLEEGNSTAGKYYVLANNITMTQSYGPIGTAENPFRGSFDGKGYTISNLTGTGDYIGLFGHLGSGATVQNLKLANVSMDGERYVGGIAAYAYATTGNITISNCTVTGSIDGNDGDDGGLYAAGIVAYAKGEGAAVNISNCTVDAAIAGDDYTAGIAGFASNASITGCTNHQMIDADDNTYYCGGIIGYARTCTVTSCVNFGAVAGNGYSDDNGSGELGGIAGIANGCSFYGCANYGNVSAFWPGGISGGYSGGGNYYESCLNAGALNYGSDGTGYSIACTRTDGQPNSFKDCVSTSKSYANLSNGATAYQMSNYFGQNIGVDSYPVQLTDSNRVYKVTVSGVVSGTYYVTTGKTVTLSDEAACVAYQEDGASFDVTTPITRDYTLTAVESHDYVDGICTGCGDVQVIASGECGRYGGELTWVLTADGKLTISGTNEYMRDFMDGPAPWMDYADDIKSVVVEFGVLSVGYGAFNSCQALTEVSIADTVVAINNHAFENCSALTSIRIPDSVSTIENYTFYGCESLRELVISSNVTKIGYSAFSSCVSLTELTLPESLTTLEGYAFSNCNGLTEVTVPKNVSTIEECVFAHGDNLTTIVVDEENAYYCNDEYGVLYSKDMTQLLQAPLMLSGAYEIPSGVTCIKYCAFSECAGLTGVTIPEGVEMIEAFAFAHCRNLPDVEIPASVTNIGERAFLYCTNMGEIAFRGDAPAFEPDVFLEITTTAYYPCGNETWTADVMQQYGGTVTWTARHVAGATEIENEVAADCTENGGYDEVIYCTECDEEISRVSYVEEALGHDYVAYEYDPTCMDAGYTEYVCFRCGDSYTEEGAPAIGKHNYETEVVDPTCVDEGYTIYSCTQCQDEYESDFVPATGVHNYEAMTTFDPTCVDYGYTDYRCDGCGEWKEDDIIPATGEHEWLEDGDGGYYCANCDAVSGGEHEHDYQYTGGQEPTCADGGYEVYTCDGCGDSYTVDLAPTDEHDWLEDDEGNYYCGNCGASEGGGHEHDYQVSDTQDPTCGEWGYTEYTCTGCGESYRDDLEPTGSHSYEGTVTEPNCTDRGYTTYTCTGCGDSYDDDYVDPNGAHEFVDGICTICGAEEEITYDMSVAGANMSLGSELAVNFFVKKVDIDTSKDYYIQVTKTYADGRADVTKTYYFQKGEWMDYNSTYYGVKFNGVAAKEMADKLYVQVFHADGTPASDVWTDSIRDYAMRMFGKGTDEKKTMYVDMLNYGAAAQTEFGYGTDDLANSKLTAEHQAYATQTIAYANNRVEGENYYGTNLNLGSSIALNMYFQNVSQDMYAIATYTDHYGNEKEVRIEGSAFVLNKASTNGYRISINTLAVADVRQLVTCTVYNTDGTVVGTCTDSVEGYIARKANSSALYDAIMRFATSAYNSFH